MKLNEVAPAPSADRLTPDEARQVVSVRKGRSLANLDPIIAEKLFILLRDRLPYGSQDDPTPAIESLIRGMYDNKFTRWIRSVTTHMAMFESNKRTYTSEEYQQACRVARARFERLGHYVKLYNDLSNQHKITIPKSTTHSEDLLDQGWVKCVNLSLALGIATYVAPSYSSHLQQLERFGSAWMRVREIHDKHVQKYNLSIGEYVPLP